MKILAVDDEQMQLKMLEKAILKAVPDCELTCMSNSIFALDWARKNRPDVIFSDIQMPVMNGLEQEAEPSYQRGLRHRVL